MLGFILNAHTVFVFGLNDADQIVKKKEANKQTKNVHQNKKQNGYNMDCFYFYLLHIERLKTREKERNEKKNFIFTDEQPA